MMLEVVRRKLEEQRLKKPKSYEMTASNLIEKLYELIDSGKIHANARVIINNQWWSHFSCTNCMKVNDRQYNETVLEFEIAEENSKYDTVEIFTRKGVRK